MGRPTIWQDGLNTRFSKENQPPNRGRKKGKPNRATIFRRVMATMTAHEKRVEVLRREHRNARRRERYAEKKALKKNGPEEPLAGINLLDSTILLLIVSSHLT